MNLKKLLYNNQLKKIELSEIQFNTVSLSDIPAPYYTDYSHHKNETARNHKSWDRMGFRDKLLKQSSEYLNDTVLKIIIITPEKKGLPYNAFAYLSSKEIVAIHFENFGNFKQWMDIIFDKQRKSLAEDTADGLFERQPELNPNPQFMLTLSKGQFSQTRANSGMMVDEKPYQNTGKYLHQKAPKQYNEAKIAKEKENYIKKYINTNGANLDETKLKNTFTEFATTKNLKSNPPQNNEEIYQEFEKLTGYAFPSALKTLFTLHNGIGNSDFLNAQEVLIEWKNWKAIYDDANWMLTDLTSNNHPDGRKTIGIYTNPYWIPFMSDGAGNFIAIDFAPGSKGTSGQIVAFGADATKIRLIAENMQDFLEQYIDGEDVLNNGL